MYVCERERKRGGGGENVGNFREDDIRKDFMYVLLNE